MRADSQQDLLTTPIRIYGTHAGTLYCPVRDMNVPQIQLNRLWLQWTLLYAERFAIPDDSQKAITLLARRAKIYAYINKLITDKLACISDTTITGLAFGSLIEWQVGSLELARQHLGFVRHTLLPQRTGTQALSFFAGFCVYSSLLSVGLGSHAFASSEAMFAAVGQFLGTMSSMQELSIEMAEGTRYKQPSNSERQPDLLASLRGFMTSRQRAFGLSSTLHNFLVPLDLGDPVLFSHQLVLLWVINRMLLELHDNLKMSAGFLDTLYRCVESHNDPSPFGSEGIRRKAQDADSPLKPFTVMSMVNHVSSSYLRGVEFNPVDGNTRKDIRDERALQYCWENVDMGEYINHWVQYLTSQENYSYIFADDSNS